MDDVHAYDIEAENSVETMFTCTVASCGRRIVIHRGEHRMTVLEQGDFFARHQGGTPGLVLSVTVDAQN